MGLKGLSLRYKLMATLMILPLVGLALFFVVAKSIFERDKIAHVFDSSLALSKTRAARVSSEISSIISVTQAIVLNYRSDTKNLADIGTYFFEREPKFDAFALFAWNAKTSNYDRNVDLGKPNGKRILGGNSQIFTDAVAQARTKPVVVGSAKDTDGKPDKLVIAVRFGEVSDVRHVIAVAMTDAVELSDVFSASVPGAPMGMLLKKDSGNAIIRALEANARWTSDSVWRELSDKKTPEGTEELRLPEGSNYLASFSDVSVGDLVVVSLQDKRLAFAAMDDFSEKALMFFVGVVGSALVISVLFARGLGEKMSALNEAAARLSSGDLSTRVTADDAGEFAQVIEQFNSLAEQMAAVRNETDEKMKTAADLAVEVEKLRAEQKNAKERQAAKSEQVAQAAIAAREIQASLQAKALQNIREAREALFPEPLAKFSGVEIAGKYLPNGDTGGDWWYYFEKGGKIYIWIGDASAHGTQAAILASAARAVASVVAMAQDRSAGDCLTLLNRVVHTIGKGQLTMRMFLVRIDTLNGELTYANASHEPPLVLRPSATTVAEENFHLLGDINNPSLGENLQHLYKEGQMQLMAGDTIVFYTDGVVNLKNSETKPFGEQGFLKSLTEGLAQAETPSAVAVEGIARDLESYRAEAPQVDDATLVVCRIGNFEATNVQDAA